MPDNTPQDNLAEEQQTKEELRDQESAAEEFAAEDLAEQEATEQDLADQEPAAQESRQAPSNENVRGQRARRRSSQKISFDANEEPLDDSAQSDSVSDEDPLAPNKADVDDAEEAVFEASEKEESTPETYDKAEDPDKPEASHKPEPPQKKPQLETIDGYVDELSRELDLEFADETEDSSEEQVDELVAVDDPAASDFDDLDVFDDQDDDSEQGAQSEQGEQADQADKVDEADAPEPAPEEVAPEPSPTENTPEQQRTKNKPQTRAQEPQPEPKAPPERITRTYLKSPSLKQAFRSFGKLKGGVAWRKVYAPVIVFMLLFALLSLAVVDSLPIVDSFNQTVNTFIQQTRGSLDPFVITLTTIGDFLPMAGICLLVCAVLYIGGKWDGLAYFITNALLAIICIQALKLIFAVPRPGDETLVPLPLSFSFPSAHSFCSLVIFGMIGLLIFRALYARGIARKAAMAPGVILVVLAIFIGLSRIYVGVHWPSDVLGGWLLAGAWLAFAGALYTAGARQR